MPGSIEVGAGADEIDVLIVGSGIAGLSVAVALSGARRVAVVSKERAGGGSTVLAQGGIAAAVGPGDNWAAHAADTVVAAAGLGDPDVAAVVTSEAAEAVSMLSALGARFDAGAPAREGGHGAARVLHAHGDGTGAELSRALLEAVRRRGVPVLTGMFLVDLLTTPDGDRAVGALLFDAAVQRAWAVRASTVVLATGGYGQLWSNTTSPRACSGDGLAAAMRAGAQVADLEFVQFHPTGMALGRDPRPLASEALRGAGARLRDSAGRLVHETTANGAGDLAPRDVVCRAMARRMSELQADHCWLDATMLGQEALRAHFPSFVSACRVAGLAPDKDWVPVSPTAHYTMGGVLTDAEGRTTLEGLMAVGEVACSGLHGANRLASNSLLEGVVIGRRVGLALASGRGPAAPREPIELEDVVPRGPGPQSEPGGMTPLASGAPDLGRDRLRAAMQAYAGVRRDPEGLQRLASYLAQEGAAGASLPCRQEGWEVANMHLVARAVTALARRRRESRGAHWRADFPEADSAWRVRQVARLLAGGELAVGQSSVGARREPVAPAAAAL